MYKKRKVRDVVTRKGNKQTQKPKKQDRSLLFLCLLFLLGALILLYPAISSKFAEINQGQVLVQYQEVVSSINQEELDAEYALAEKYNNSLTQNKVTLTDPFDPNAPKFPDGDYETLLDLTDAMATIVIPAIKVNLPVYHGTETETLEKGVGHLEATSLPVGGVGSHAVLSAHCGLPSAELFTNLSKLQLGDVFEIEVLGRTLYYQVDAINVVEPTDTSLLYIDPEQDYVTLVTCTPYGINSHRLLVRGTRVFPEENEEVLAAVEEPSNYGLSTVEIIQRIMFGVAILLVIAFVTFLIIALLRKKDEKDEHEDTPPTRVAAARRGEAKRATRAAQAQNAVPRRRTERSVRDGGTAGFAVAEASERRTAPTQEALRRTVSARSGAAAMQSQLAQAVVSDATPAQSATPNATPAHNGVQSVQSGQSATPSPSNAPSQVAPIGSSAWMEAATRARELAKQQQKRGE